MPPWSPNGERRLQATLCLLLLCSLAACASQHRGYGYGSGPRNYQPPGPPGDPWGSYIREASGRFRVPERWVRAVMQQESGGNQYLNGTPITSSAGAMGLMQVMPETYEGLRDRYRLGNDPYDPHDNILAGTAYIREMLDQYGSPAFLAAYNAGPRRLDLYLGQGAPLPDETVNYVAAVAPQLGPEVAQTGPLSVYADNGSQPVRRAEVPAPYALPPAPTAAPVSYAPPPAPEVSAPAPPAVAASPAPIVSAPTVTPAPSYVGSAFAPVSLPAPVPVGVTRVAYAPPPPAAVPSFSAPSPAPPAPRSGWSIQVGAFASPDEARLAATSARLRAGGPADTAQIAIGSVRRVDGMILYRARLTGLSADGADQSCNRLRTTGFACALVPPEG